MLCVDGSCWLVSCPFIHLNWTKSARTKNVNGNSKRNVLLHSMLKDKMNCLDKPIDFRFTDRFPVAQKHFTFHPYFMKSLFFFYDFGHRRCAGCDVFSCVSTFSIFYGCTFPQFSILFRFNLDRLVKNKFTFLSEMRENSHFLELCAKAMQ